MASLINKSNAINFGITNVLELFNAIVSMKPIALSRGSINLCNIPIIYGCVK